MSADHIRANCVTVYQDGKAVYADVLFDHGSPRSWYMTYKYVSASSLKRLARAINNLGMLVELDEYGVPTWTRKGGE